MWLFYLCFIFKATLRFFTLLLYCEISTTFDESILAKTCAMFLCEVRGVELLAVI